MGSTFRQAQEQEQDVETRFERVYRTPDLARQAIMYYMEQVAQRDRAIQELQFRLRESEQKHFLLMKELSEGRWVKVV